MDPWKRRFLLETIISRFHVNFWGCSLSIRRDFFCHFATHPGEVGLKFFPYLEGGSSQDGSTDTWFITMVIGFVPEGSGKVGPLTNGHSWLINRGYYPLANWDDPPSN